MNAKSLFIVRGSGRPQKRGMWSKGAMQSQKAVSAYITTEQILLFSFAEQMGCKQ